MLELHYILSSAAKRAGLPIAVGVLAINLLHKPHSSTLSRRQISATFCFQSVSLRLQVLVDSWAGGSFTDQEVTKQCGLPLEPLPSPTMANTLNGIEVTHHTVILSGNHSEQIRLCIISAPYTPVVLGFPWLKVHKPQIEWAKNNICGVPSACPIACSLPHFLRLPSITVTKKPLDLSTVRLRWSGWQGASCLTTSSPPLRLPHQSPSWSSVTYQPSLQPVMSREGEYRNVHQGFTHSRYHLSLLHLSVQICFGFFLSSRQISPSMHRIPWSECYNHKK